MIKAIVENASAQKGTLFLAEEESETSKLWVCAEYDYESRYHQLLNVETNTLTSLPDRPLGQAAANLKLTETSC